MHACSIVIDKMQQLVYNALDILAHITAYICIVLITPFHGFAQLSASYRLAIV